LETQDVAGFYAYLCEGLGIEELFATGSVVDLVAEGLAVGGVLGEVHLLQEDGDQAVDWGVVGHLDFLPLVAGRIPDLHAYQGHATGIPDLRDQSSCGRLRGIMVPLANQIALVTGASSVEREAASGEKKILRLTGAIAELYFVL
jgi:hypothetical protein